MQRVEFAGQPDAEVARWESHGRAVGKKAVAARHLPESAFQEVDALFADIAADYRAPLGPQELAMLANQHTWTSNGHVLWLGKEFLLGWKWNGFRDL